MDRFALACLVLIGCSSDAPKNDPVSAMRGRADAGAAETPKSADVVSDTVTPDPGTGETTPVETPDAGVTPPPPDAAGPICDLGNGLYCGGNHAPGAANELYRCTDGVATLEETCAGDCAKFPDGQNDRCSCALGDGLYCGGNGVNGDVNTLYRCTGNVVTQEKTCANGCAPQPDGFNDKCF